MTVPFSRSTRILLLALTAAVGGVLSACDSSDSSGGGGGAGGGGAAGGAGGAGGGTTSTTGGSFGALTHCAEPAYHCKYPSGLFSCAEYSDADSATYEDICNNAAGTWSAGYCDETGAVGQCLPLNYCMGMGIGFATDASVAADAEQSCKDTGGTWQLPTTN